MKAYSPHPSSLFKALPDLFVLLQCIYFNYVRDLRMCINPSSEKVTVCAHMFTYYIPIGQPCYLRGYIVLLI